MYLVNFQKAPGRLDNIGWAIGTILLVVVMIAGFFVFLMNFNRAPGKARMVVCMNNQKQIATAILAYAQDHNNTLPAGATVWADIPKYYAPDASTRFTTDDIKTITRCYESPNGNSYGYNTALSNVTIRDLSEDDMTKIILTADSNNSKNLLYTTADFDAFRHNGNNQKLFYERKSNSKAFIVTYLDGHAKLLFEDSPSSLILKPTINQKTTE